MNVPTLPESQQYKGDLSVFPNLYIHVGCPAGSDYTVIPEAVQRTYLNDPYFYTGDAYCACCGSVVSDRDCQWVETGENVRAYFDRLRSELPAAVQRVRAWTFPIFLSIGMGAGLIAALVGGRGDILPSMAGGGVLAVMVAFVSRRRLYAIMLKRWWRDRDRKEIDAR